MEKSKDLLEAIELLEEIGPKWFRAMSLIDRALGRTGEAETLRARLVLLPGGRELQAGGGDQSPDIGGRKGPSKRK